MRIRSNRRTETEAVNAVRSFFERNDCVVQSVNLENDYGRDAFVDLTCDRRLTGTCIGVQIKGGASYKRSSGYAIPVDEHFDVWSDSSVPIAGLVYDADNESIHWCSITGHLASLCGERPSSIPVPVDNVLTSETLHSVFRPHFEREAKRTAAGNCILNVCSDAEDRRTKAIHECFAHGRHDERVLIALRYLLNALDDRNLYVAVMVLAHVTPHPDILWTKQNWIPESVCSAVLQHFRWSPLEAQRLLQLLEDDENGFTRGCIGEDIYMMLHEDPSIRTTIETTLDMSLDAGLEKTAWFAFYLSLYWAGRNAAKKLAEHIARRPDVQSLDLFHEAAMLVSRDGYVNMF